MQKWTKLVCVIWWQLWVVEITSGCSSNSLSCIQNHEWSMTAMIMICYIYTCQILWHSQTSPLILLLQHIFGINCEVHTGQENETIDGCGHFMTTLRLLTLSVLRCHHMEGSHLQAKIKIIWLPHVRHCLIASIYFFQVTADFSHNNYHYNNIFLGKKYSQLLDN